MHDLAVLALRRKVELVPSEKLMTARPRRQAIVEVDLQNGQRLSHRTRAVRGTADNPMTQGEVEAKAFDLMVGVLGPDRAKKLVEACRTIEYIQDMCDLRQYWEGADDDSVRRSA
jgi:2-methylcitrate dehydratase PrpD